MDGAAMTRTMTSECYDICLSMHCVAVSSTSNLCCGWMLLFLHVVSSMFACPSSPSTRIMNAKLLSAVTLMAFEFLELSVWISRTYCIAIHKGYLHEPEIVLPGAQLATYNKANR